MMRKEPLETNVTDGLAEMHEAAELIPEDKVEELAEKAKKEAEEATSEYRKKHEEKRT
ncbi:MULTISPECIES: hypothetical protein [Enterobacteriaceae]|uniref:hypothetical protein n=1 Tax=Enterobacteriaceae TaxID=543 RepID=UPI00159F8419|nr:MULTISPECIES: hypothetical protein [Enterobacteriaceae]MBK4555596.1 hypothetical protein [Enterobacter hormaechei]MBK4631726.1 hypothetical protein [Enterobacter hormaechei]MCM7069671.1 hypothetical protein [Enterobacter hormaechei]MDM3414550.1 hypothetical protein [Citrobacter sp. Cb021]QLO91733.1 hypothetical protein HV048_21315 [Enterobacter hormaechei]